VAGTSQPRGQRWRVPFSIRTSPGDSDSSAPSSSWSARLPESNDPEIRRVGPVKAGVSSTEFVAILEVHLGVGSGAMKSPGKYVPMMKRMPPKGGNIPRAAGLFPAFG